MLRSEERIVTTHAGSLPRSPELLRLLVDLNDGREVDRDAFRARVAADLADVLRRQQAAGIDVPSDGELPRIGFSFYVKDRMSGFGGASSRGTLADFHRYPGWAALKAGSSRVVDEEKDMTQTATLYDAPAAVDRIVYDPELAAAREELALFADALAASGASFPETFVSAATPGIVSTTLIRTDDNPAYADDRAYVLDLAEQLKLEYDLIVGAGHVLQLDAPDLAMEREIMFQDRPLDEFLARVELHVEALNRACRDVPPDRVRLHVCWGNYDGPHTHDVPLEEVLPLLYRANVGALYVAGGNHQHQHDHKAFRRHPLPDGMVLVAGVVDVTTNYTEHPEVVADRIVQFADAVGDPRRVVAATDCGFSTFAGYTMVAEDVAWTKLEVLAEGARRATERLFG